MASQLRPRPEVHVVDAAELDQAEVAVVVAERVDEEVLRVLRAVRRGSVPRTVLIAGSLDDAAVVTAAEAGVSALVRRSEVTPERLVSVILKARDGGAEMPADLLAGLLGQVGRLQRQVLAPRGLRFSGLSDREVEVLRLVADGLDTGEIARELAFSERTIKSVLRRVRGEVEQAAAGEPGGRRWRELRREVQPAFTHPAPRTSKSGGTAWRRACSSLPHVPREATRNGVGAYARGHAATPRGLPVLRTCAYAGRGHGVDVGPMWSVRGDGATPVRLVGPPTTPRLVVCRHPGSSPPTSTARCSTPTTGSPLGPPRSSTG